MSYQPRPWELNLKKEGFVPTNKNYTAASPNECITCQIYEEIDSFARACSLQKLWPISTSDLPEGSTIRGGGIAVPDGYFNAAPLLEALKTIKDPSHTARKDEDNLQTFLRTWASPPKSNDGHVIAGPITQNEFHDLEASTIAFAHELWLGFLKARTPAPAAPNPALFDDYVAIARLMFAWIAYSVAYDNELLKRDILMDQIRPVYDILTAGQEVCAGYGRMFQTMFNAVAPNLPFLVNANPARGLKGADYIIGHVRPGGGLQAQADRTENTVDQHAWSAFPLRSNADIRSYKVVDPTWARPRKESGRLNEVWWGSTNESLATTHIPFDDYPEWLRYTTKPMPPDTTTRLWNQPEPFFPAVGSNECIWIDTSTVTPFQNKIDLLSAGSRTIEVAFNNNCPHQRDHMPKTWLSFRQLNFSEWANKKARPSELNFTITPSSGSFQIVQDANAPHGYKWVARVNIPQDVSEGLLAVVGAFKQGFRIAQPLAIDKDKDVEIRPIVAWQLQTPKR